MLLILSIFSLIPLNKFAECLLFAELLIDYIQGCVKHSLHTYESCILFLDFFIIGIWSILYTYTHTPLHTYILIDLNDKFVLD